MVIYYLEEAPSDDLENRRNYDYENVREMLYELGLENIEVVKTSRIGKRKQDWTTKARPLVVKFKSKKDKWTVLGKGKDLKNTNCFSGIYLALDMEKEEFEKNKALRHELVERRNNGENISIKNGRIINKRKNRLVEQDVRGQTYQSFQSGNNIR